MFEDVKFNTDSRECEHCGGETSGSLYTLKGGEQPLSLCRDCAGKIDPSTIVSVAVRVESFADLRFKAEELAKKQKKSGVMWIPLGTL